MTSDMETSMIYDQLLTEMPLPEAQDKHPEPSFSTVVTLTEDGSTVVTLIEDEDELPFDQDEDGPCCSNPDHSSPCPNHDE